MRATRHLEDRLLLLERVLRAVGSFRYSQRCKPLLVSTRASTGGSPSGRLLWVDYAGVSPRNTPFMCISLRGEMVITRGGGSAERVKEVLKNCKFTPFFLMEVYAEFFENEAQA